MRQKTALIVAAMIAVAAAAHADPPRVYAITGGTVHPVSGPDIANGVVLIRDGLIEAVGSSVTIPPDAATIDAKGGHVYPGLIDAQTSLGFPSAAPRPQRRGTTARTQTPAQDLPDTSAAFMALREAKIADDDLDAKRATGVTTIVTAPSFGIFNGQSAILNLGEGNIDSRVIRASAAQQISFNTRPAWTYPDSLMGVVAYIRQTFLDAQQNAAARAIYEKSPTGTKRPDDSVAARALDVVMRREVPVVFVADSEAMIRRAQEIAREFNLRYIVSGARQGYRMAPDLKEIPVLVSVKWPVAPPVREDREEQPLRMIRDRQLAPTTPGVLSRAGVQFALVSGAAGKTGDFLPGIRKAMDNGLSATDALRAVTLSPARIFGIDRQLGSIDRGKIANLVVTDKPIFTKDMKITHLYIDGREIRVAEEPSQRRSGETGPLDGTWSLTVKTAQGDVSISATLRVESGNITGSFSGDRGSGPISSGTFEGTTVEFTIATRSQAETGDWVFHGALRDDKLEGTVSTTLGTFPFTGSKSR